MSPVPREFPKETSILGRFVKSQATIVRFIPGEPCQFAFLFEGQSETVKVRCDAKARPMRDVDDMSDEEYDDVFVDTAAGT